MTCRELVEFLMDYLDGELAPGQVEAFELHLARCEACVGYMKSYLQTIRLGRLVFKDLEASVPSDVPDDLVKAIVQTRNLRP